MLTRELVDVRDNYVYQHIDCLCNGYCRGCEHEETFPSDCPLECLEEKERVERRCEGRAVGGDYTSTYAYCDGKTGELLFFEKRVSWIDYGNSYGTYSVVKPISPRIELKTGFSSSGHPCWKRTEILLDGKVIGIVREYLTGRSSKTWPLDMFEEVQEMI